jgi:hypothetical protein
VPLRPVAVGLQLKAKADGDGTPGHREPNKYGKRDEWTGPRTKDMVLKTPSL